MKLHFNNEWLMKQIDAEPDGLSVEIGMCALAEAPPAWAIEKAEQIDVTGVHRGINVHIAIARAIDEADRAATERAAKYHDDQIAKLEAQIAQNDAYKLRSGHQDNSANDYCRKLIINHRLSAAAIRGAGHE